MAPNTIPGTSHPGNPVVDLLLARHKEFIAAVNDRDFDLAYRCTCWVSPDFTADIMYTGHIASWADYVETFRSVTADHPDFFINLIEVSASVREDLGKADVYLVAAEQGRTPGVVTQATSKLSWKKDAIGDKLDWLLVKHIMFRGLDTGAL